MTDPAAPCPCRSGDRLDACCGPVLAGARAAPTALALMRSRFTAFAVGDADHLLASWDSRTRPASLELDDDIDWLGLRIVETVRGGPLDDAGIVEFVATGRGPDGVFRQRERSAFRRSGGRWRYVDGTETAG